MIVVVQRSKNATCSVDGVITGKCDNGFMILVGLTHTDTINDLEKVAKKVAGLRVFEDENGKMNKSLNDVNGTILSISQFTLYANCRSGNRPGFTDAMEPVKAKELYLEFNEILRNKYNLHVEEGIFGADMKINFMNDGPITIILDSAKL